MTDYSNRVEVSIREICETLGLPYNKKETTISTKYSKQFPVIKGVGLNHVYQVHI